MRVEALRRLASASLVLVACLGGSRADDLAPKGGLKSFPNSIVPLPAPTGLQPNAIEEESSRNVTLQIHFSFGLRDTEDLRAKVANGRTIDPNELSRYFGDPAQVMRLTAWLKSVGYKNVVAAPDNSGVYAQGSAGTVEQSLKVEMRAVNVNGRTVPTAVSPPQLPSDIGDSVVAIDGLQPWVRATRHLVPAPGAGMVGHLSRQPAGAAKSRGALTPKDVRSFYNVPDSLTGRNQIVAVLIDTLPARSDLNAFAKRHKIKAGQVKFFQVQGAAFVLPPREVEETLDTEWVAGVAPGAEIRVYAAGSLQFTYLERAIDQIIADAARLPRLRHVSISLGLAETYVSADTRRVEAEKFLLLSALGVSVFVSSGDSGSNPDITGHGRGTADVVEYGASDPSVVAVGGTSWKFDERGNRVGEVAWEGSGGGISSAAPRPAWQRRYGELDPSWRLVPDVSSVADPAPGAVVVFNGRSVSVGGTSWSAPTWAAFSAIIAEAMELRGKPPTGFLAPKLYGLHASFRDIVDGGNGRYKAGPGWNPVTGLGSPDIAKLIDELP